MADYYETKDGTVTRRGPGMIIGGVLLVLAAIVAVLFATGFWSADVSGGKLPAVKVSADSGALPSVDLNSKQVVVGSKAETVDVPKVDTTKATIKVPVIGVKN